jgi:hypothetical protein
MSTRIWETVCLVKMGTMSAIFYVIGGINFYPYLTHLLRNLDEFQYIWSAHNVAKQIASFVTVGAGKAVPFIRA